jgi:shikimate kinase
MNMILCGLPMCGKTTIGKILADQMGWNFIDTDQLIEDSYAIKMHKRRSCREIAIQEGEPFFRLLEKQSISSLKAIKKSVIAIGGGSLCDPDSLNDLKKIGCFVYLKTPTDILLERMKLRGIYSFLDPANAHRSFEEMAKRRMPLYDSVANLTIETNTLGSEEIVSTIIRTYHY